MTEKKEYPNSMVFFANSRKREGKNDCDYDGNGEITCVHCGKKNSFWVNIWSKVGAKGDFWSGSFKHKDAKPQATSASSGGRSLSSGTQQDMGYSRDARPHNREDRPQAERRDFGRDISDEIPF